MFPRCLRRDKENEKSRMLDMSYNIIYLFILPA